MNINLNNLKGKIAVILLCAPPASGKSTFGKKFCEENNFIHISTDSIRAEVGKGESDQSVSYLAFTIAKKRFIQNLSFSKNVMIDATNCDKKARKEWISLAREYKVHIIAVAFEFPAEELYKRDSLRERKVGKEIIDRFVSKYQRPTTEEVDEVFVINK